MKILVLASGFMTDHGGQRKVIEWMFSSFSESDELIICGLEIGAGGPENQRLQAGMVKDENLFIIKGVSGKSVVLPYCQLIMKHKPDIIFDVSALNIKVITLLCSFFLGFRKRHIFCEHAPVMGTLPLTKNRLMKALIPYAFRSAAYVMTVSASQMTFIADLFRLKKDSYGYIYNPIDVPQINIKADGDLPIEGLSSTVPLIVTVCRLDPYAKDVTSLIKSFAMVLKTKPDAVLAIAGVGPGREQWEALAKSLKIEKQVKFLGYIDNPMPLIKRADVYVQSSNFESFCLVLFEAIACGTPVVSTDCDFGPAELLDNGMYGQLVDVGNITQITEAILRVLEEPAKYFEIAERAAKHIENLSPDIILQSYRNLFERIVCENRD